MRTLVSLAAPIATAMAGETVMGLVDTKLVGGLGPAALGGVGVAMTIAFFGYLSIFGLMRGVKVCVAHAVGQGQGHRGVRYAQAGIALGVAAGAAVWACTRDVTPLLRAIRIDPALVAPGARVPRGLHRRCSRERRGLGPDAPSSGARRRTHAHGRRTRCERHQRVARLGPHLRTRGPARARRSRWRRGHGHGGAVRGDGARRAARAAHPAIRHVCAGADRNAPAARGARGRASRGPHRVAVRERDARIRHVHRPPRDARHRADRRPPDRSGHDTHLFPAGDGRLRGRERARRPGARAPFARRRGPHDARGLAPRRRVHDELAASSSRSAAASSCARSPTTRWSPTSRAGCCSSRLAFQVLDAVSIVLRGALRGARDVRVPALIGVAVVWTCVPTAALLLGRVAGWGAAGGWCGFLAETTLGAVLFGARWRRGSWRRAYAVQAARSGPVR